jgi:hypothetical protein
MSISIKRLFMTKKIVVVGAAVAVTIGASTAAFAFFSSTGNGAGSASVGSATVWEVHQSAATTGGPLFPDAVGGFIHNVETDKYLVSNNSNGSQYLTSVVVSIANADNSAWSAQADITKPACTASDFSVGGQAVGTPWTDASLQGDLPAHSGGYGNVTVEMIDNGLNQDNCQGVTVPLYFSAS